MPLKKGKTLMEKALALDPELLGDIVHDLKSKEASEINNSGANAQVQYALAQGMTLEEIIQTVVDNGG